MLHRLDIYKFYFYEPLLFKGALLGLRQFLAIRSPIKIMKNGFYFTLKTLFVLKIFTCLNFLVIYKKRLNQKTKVNFEIYDITTWLTNQCNTRIAQYLIKKRQLENEIWSVNIRRPFSKKSKLNIFLDHQSKVLKFVFTVC